MFWLVGLTIILVFLILECVRTSQPPVAGVYRLKGKFYYLKKWAFYLLLLLNARRGKHHARKEREDQSVKAEAQSSRKERGYGKTVADPDDLEACNKLEDHPDGIDTVYFNGFDQDGTFFALRIARVHNRKGEVWVWLNLPEIGFLQHPLHPDTAIYNMGDGEYVGGGCRVQMLDPMRRWKVSYNGLLRVGLCNDVKKKPEKYLNVKVTFTWTSLNDPFNFDTDLDKALLSDAIAREPWTKAFWDRLRGGHQTHYEQIGELSGKIEVEGHPARQVHLRSIRDHTIGIRNWFDFHRYCVHYIHVEETGTMAMVAIISMPETMSHLKTGFLMYGNGHTFPVTGISLNLWEVTETWDPPESYSFSFTAGGEEYNVDVKTMITPILYHYTERQSRILERFCTYTINGKFARGLTEFHYRNPDGPPVESPEVSIVPFLREPDTSDIANCHNTFCFQFEQAACASSQLVGGKGSQLALLTSIQNKIGAVVPKGFCVSLSAFDEQLKCNTDLELGVEKILAASRKEGDQSLQSVCSDVVEMFASCKITPAVEDKILAELCALFGEDYHQVPLAVRSSAAGEDGGEASSAGQMETYLGVRGKEKVLEAIKKCWASAYTYQAVEYRRQHGQPIRTAVGVVIQEVVQSEVSGVLFTHDPVSGNVNRMVLDASYGLGEAVVSGKTTPDSFKVQRLQDNSLTIQERGIGDKSMKISIADNGVKEETYTESGQQSCLTDEQILHLCAVGIKFSDLLPENGQQSCLTDEQILHLCSVGIKIEQHFGSGRDIEWAMCDGILYLLQARPITTMEQETDEDFMHEFDSPVSTNTERLTLGNIGEMMPGCVTPLTLSTFARAIDICTRAWMVEFAGGYVTQLADKMMASFCGRLFINLTYSAQLSSNSLIFNKGALEMNLIGEVMEDHTLDGIIRPFGWTNKSVLSKLWVFLTFLWNHNKKVKVAESWHDKLKTYSVGPDCQSAVELYSEIDRKLPDYYSVWENTVAKSAQSGNWGGILMGVVSGGKDAWTVDNYADVGLLLSQCQNVYSAEVPTAMQELAKLIVDCGVEEKFMKLDEKECVNLLTSEKCDPVLKEKFATFIDRHGHRCVREAEFIEKSWRAEPEKLMKVLKAILKSKSYEHKDMEPPSIEKALQNLRSPVTGVGKFLLRNWIVPKARDAVGQREWGKSIAIKMVDKLKEAYWRLSEFLEKEGRLPDGELMFFLTHREIGQLIQTRSARLISRAIRRRKILPLQSRTEFPKNCIGRPQPIKSSVVEEERKTSFTLNGMPVSQGSVKGVARVVLSLEDADKIQKGDVLIVSYTDVGWSPYFPLISGLITEMGGLVSHGAVVAREYGLPCIVNVPQATRLLQTGDHINVDGATGTIDKLEQD